MRIFRILPVLIAVVSFSNALAEEANRVTGYHRFLSANGSDEEEDEAFRKARIDAYQQCYGRHMRPKPESSLELMFPALMGVGDSNCKASPISLFEPRHYECFAWYKATCIPEVAAAAESAGDSNPAQDDGSSGAGGSSGSGGSGGEGGAGGGTSHGNDGAEGAPAY